MKARLSKLTSLLLSFICLHSALYGQTPYLRSHKIIKSSKSYTTNVILQDMRGFLWFGTSKGLVFFDGQDYILFNSSNGMADDAVTAICEDSAGIIWLGHQNGKISLFENGSVSVFDPEEGMGQVPITDIIIGQDNKIWFTTLGEGIYYYNGQRLYNLNTDDGLSDDYAYSLVAGQAGDIWIGTDHGISRYIPKKNEFRNISMAEGLPDNIVRKILMDSLGGIWCGTDEEGIFYFQTETGKIILYPDWTFGSVSDMILHDDELWLATSRSGVVKVPLIPGEMNRYRMIQQQQGLLSNKTNCLYEDLERNCWIGTDEGVSQVLSPVFEFLDKRHDIPFEMVYDFLVDQSGKSWICSDQGVFVMDMDESGQQSYTRLFRGSEFSDAHFITLYLDPSGFVWAGTYDYGVLRIDPVSFDYDNFNTTDGLGNNDVISVSGKGDIILFSTLGGGVTACNIRTSDPVFTQCSEGNISPAEYVYSTFIDSRDRIWYASADNRISYLENRELKTLRDADSLDMGAIYYVAEDQRNNIWFIAENNGLYCYNGREIINYREEDGLVSTDIKSISPDKYGNLLIVSNEGIDLYHPDEKYFSHYGESYGVTNTEPVLNAIYRSEKGQIWIGTGRGIIRYNPDNLVNSKSEPCLFLTDIKLFDEVLQRSSNKFNYRQNHLVFNYTGLWYQDPSSMVYRYMLEGYDLEWSAPTNSRTQTYSKLPPGIYLFRVQLSLDYSKWTGNEESIYAFVIKPPFYLRWWFISIFILAVLLAIYIVFRVRLANLRKQKDELVQQVKIATAEIRTKNETLKSQNAEIQAQRDLVMEQRDRISDQQQNLQSSIRYALRIQRAVLTPDSIISGLLKDYFILNRPRDIVSGDFYWVAEKSGHLFVAVADSTGHGVPGAFMSMLGVSSFDEILNGSCGFRAGGFLTLLRDHLKKSLHQDSTESESKDGMDVALCILNWKTGELSFSGAFNPLYRIRDNRLEEFKGNKMPIGQYTGGNLEFTDHSLSIMKDDCYYIFSDGYPDQFGGEKGKKFKYSRFKNLLIEIHGKEMSRQIEILEKTIEDWKGGNDQIDDILVMGFRT